MGAQDEAKNRADELADQAKGKFDEATDDRDLENEGKGDQVKSNLKDAGDKAKDVFGQ
ncbi:hypothetical protein ACWGH5_16055 [Streptomyces sp. NPDC054864]